MEFLEVVPQWLVNTAVFIAIGVGSLLIWFIKRFVAVYDLRFTNMENMTTELNSKVGEIVSDHANQFAKKSDLLQIQLQMSQMSAEIKAEYVRKDIFTMQSQTHQLTINELKADVKEILRVLSNVYFKNSKEDSSSS